MNALTSTDYLLALPEIYLATAIFVVGALLTLSDLRRPA